MGLADKNTQLGTTGDGWKNSHNHQTNKHTKIVPHHGQQRHKNYSFNQYSAKRINHQQSQAKRIKFHSNAAGASSSSTSSSDILTTKLDPTKPEHAHKIAQRRKDVEKGKNTVGYSEYIAKVPKDKRRLRSMETPSTPDHTMDISNKRWMGQIKAWRKSLHQYDPPDLQKSMAFAAIVDQPKNRQDMNATNKNVDATTKMSVQDQQLAKAKSDGLLVAFDSAASCAAVGASATASTPAPVHGEGTIIFNNLVSPEMNELDQWDIVRSPQKDSSNNIDDDDDVVGFGLDDDSDSDDDLL